jgi:hypothetical protein
MSEQYGYICLIDADAKRHEYQGFYVPEASRTEGAAYLMEVKAALHQIGRGDDKSVSGGLQSLLFEATRGRQPFLPFSQIAAALIEHTGHRYLEIEGRRKDDGWLTTLTAISAASPEDASQMLGQRHRQLAIMKEMLTSLKGMASTGKTPE